MRNRCRHESSHVNVTTISEQYNAGSDSDWQHGITASEAVMVPPYSFAHCPRLMESHTRRAVWPSQSELVSCYAEDGLSRHLITVFRLQH